MPLLQVEESNADSADGRFVAAASIFYASASDRTFSTSRQVPAKLEGDLSRNLFLFRS
jgi:hypothetical protein